MALCPNNNASPSWIPLTDTIGINFTTLINFFENPSSNHIIPVPNPVEITIFGVHLVDIAMAPIVF